jgi:hypothetical protein
MLKRLFVLSLALAPMVTLAQAGITTTYVDSIINALSKWISALVPILIALAVVVLFYGIVRYIWGGAEDKEKAKNLLIWGVIALAVMVSIWGLVGLLQSLTGVTTGGTLSVPDVPAVSI